MDDHPAPRNRKTGGRPWIQAVFLQDPERPDVHFMVLVSRKTGSGWRPHADTSRHAEDHALVQSALRGDMGATDELASRLSCVPPMVRALHSRLGGDLPEEDLNEVTQETLIALWRKLDRFEGRSKLETWAYGFASRQVLKGLEKARRGPRRVEWSDDDAAQLVAHSGPSPDEYRAVHEQVDAIGPPGSDIIRMRHFDELTFDEIGGRLDMPTNTVKTRYYRSLDRLRHLLRRTWTEHRT